MNLAKPDPETFVGKSLAEVQTACNVYGIRLRVITPGALHDSGIFSDRLTVYAQNRADATIDRAYWG